MSQTEKGICMNDNNDNLDLLDLNTEPAIENEGLPDAALFVSPKPKRPWLLFVVGFIIIILAVFIIIRTVSNGSSSAVDIDLDDGGVVVSDVESRDVPVAVAQPQPVQVQVEPQPLVENQLPVAQPQPSAPSVVQQPVVQQPNDAVAPIRVVADRKDVTFNPAKVPEPVKPVVVKKAEPKKIVKQPVKPVVKKQTVSNGGWYVQFGSYSSRDAAKSAESKLRSGHSSLFNGKQFVILAAQLPNGTTTYRLRVAFATSNDANGFCRNAKSDGLDCYVAQ